MNTYVHNTLVMDTKITSYVLKLHYKYTYASTKNFIREMCMRRVSIKCINFARRGGKHFLRACVRVCPLLLIR